MGSTLGMLALALSASNHWPALPPGSSYSIHVPAIITGVRVTAVFDVVLVKAFVANYGL